MKNTVVLVSLMLLTVLSCKTPKEKHIKTPVPPKKEEVVKEKEVVKEEEVKEETKEDVAKKEFLKKAKKFFEKYIVIRLKEVDKDGFASEYEEAREFYYGDINLDGVPDAVVLYTIEGVGGGNNWSRYILLITNKNNEPYKLNHTNLYGTLFGRGEFIGIQKGYAVFDMLRYHSTNLDSIIKEQNPTKKQRIGYGIRGDRIVVDVLKNYPVKTVK